MNVDKMRHQMQRNQVAATVAAKRRAAAAIMAFLRKYVLRPDELPLSESQIAFLSLSPLSIPPPPYLSRGWHL